jgi:hypothetical protein
VSLSRCFIDLNISAADRTEVRRVVQNMGGTEEEGLMTYLAALGVDQESLRVQLLDLDQDVAIREVAPPVAPLQQSRTRSEFEDWVGDIPIIEDATPSERLSELRAKAAYYSTTIEDIDAEISSAQEAFKNGLISEIERDAAIEPRRLRRVELQERSDKVDVAIKAELERPERAVFETGEAVVVKAYHGTPAGAIEKLDRDKLGTNTGAPDAAQGFFLAASPATAGVDLYTGVVGRGAFDLITGDKGPDGLSKYDKQNLLVEAYIEANFTVVEVRAKWNTGGLTKYNILDKDGNRVTASEPFGGSTRDFDTEGAAEAGMRFAVDDILRADDALTEALYDEHLVNQVGLNGRGSDARIPYSQPTVLPAYVRMKNPMVVDHEGRGYDGARYGRWLTMAEDAGHDGLIIENSSDGAEVDNIFVVFDPQDVTWSLSISDSPNLAPGLELFQTTPLRRGAETLKRFGLEPGKTHSTRDVAVALEARQRKKYGVIDRDDRSDKASRRIANWMVEEVLFEAELAQVNPEKSAVGWYSKKFQTALDLLGAAFPEFTGNVDSTLPGVAKLGSQQNARDFFTALMAVMSDGAKVADNFKFAATVYEGFRQTGQIDTNISWGADRNASMRINLKNISDLLEQSGPDAMTGTLMHKETVKELKRMAKEEGLSFSSDYKATMRLPYAALLFGPKLGAFYANLMGDTGYLTMDRWWSRTFNRYRGNLLTKPTQQGLARFKELLIVAKRLNEPAEMITDETAAYATVEYAKSYAKKGFKNGTEIEKAANTIYKAAFVNTEDAPYNASDREFMINTATKAQKSLARKGVDLTIADIQAVLWYYEKRLYAQMGARATGDVSYEEIAKKVADSRVASGDMGLNGPNDENAGEAGGTTSLNPADTQELSATEGVATDGESENETTFFQQASRSGARSGTDGVGDQRDSGSDGVPLRSDGSIGLTHFSRQSGLIELDPSFHGTGLKGAESRRKEADPKNWVNRTYYGIDDGGYVREAGLGIQRYTTTMPPDSLYDFTNDPDGLKANLPTQQEAQYDGLNRTNIYERLIRDAGYEGYYTKSALGYAAAVYTPQAVEAVEAEAFNQDSGAPLGSYNPATGAIKAFESADLSTLLHETGHAFVHMMGVLAAREDAPQSIKDNYAAMLDWVGATSADELNPRLYGQAAVDKQEKLARTFEAYLMEGKAPSARLRAAFVQFREWLLLVYKSIGSTRTLDAEIDPKISAIFDRMLASEQEMAQHRDANAVAGGNPAILELMTDKERATYIQNIADAKAVDEDEAARILLEAEQQAKQDWWRLERLKMQEGIEAELWERPDNRAFYFLTRGDFRTGETPEGFRGRRLSKELLLDMGITQEQLTAMPRGAKRSVYASDSAGETMSPDELAVATGFDTGQELVYALMNRAPVETEAAAAADAAMTAKYGDPVTDGSRETLQEEAIYNATRRKTIKAELDALARKTGQQKVAREVIKEVVDRVFAERPVGELLTPMKYQAASVRAAQAYERALAKGDYVGAFEQKRIQMLNFELFRRGLKARDEVKKITTKLNKYQRSSMKNSDKDTVAALKDLLHVYEFGSKTKAKLNKERSEAKAKQAMAFLETQRAAGEPIVMPGELLDYVDVDGNTGKPRFKFKLKHWRDMTLVELQSLRDTVDNLVARGKANSAAATEAAKKEAEALAAGIYERTQTARPTIAPATPTYQEQVKGAKARGFFASHRKLESMMRELDGFENLGPMWSALFDGLATAQDTKTTMVKNIMEKFDSVFSVYDPKVRYRMSDKNRRTKIPGLTGAGFTHEQRVAIALNWGNESSRKAILEDSSQVERYGEAWNEAAVGRILETLTDQDWAAVTGIWELVNSYWPQIAELEKRTTGVTPKKVEASPFTVGGRTFVGGYYPLKYNPYADRRVEKEVQGDLQRQVQSGGFARAHTTHGFTTERVGSGKRPVRTDFGVLMSHLDEVTQDLAYREAINKAAKLLAQPAIRDAITATMSAKHLENIDSILLKVANGHLAQAKGWMNSGVIANARINILSALMGGNLRTILTQPLGVFQSVARIGAMWTMRGYSEFAVNPLNIPSQIREIHRQSAYMTERSRTMIRELEDITSTVEMPNRLSKLKEFGFKPLTFVDVVAVAYPTWLGAKAKAIAGKVNGVAANDEAAAIKYADSAVRTSQSAGGALNLSMIQQADEMHKLATMFGSYFNATYNMEAEAYAQAKQTGKWLPFIGDTILLSVIPAVAGALLLERWPSEEDKEDEDEWIWTKWLAVQMFTYVTGQLFIVRDLANAATTGFDFSPSPAISLGGGVTRTVTGSVKAYEELVEEGTVSDTWVKNFIRTSAMLTGAPYVNQAVKSVDWLMANQEDDLHHEPRNVAEKVQQALLTGDRKK